MSEHVGKADLRSLFGWDSHGTELYDVVGGIVSTVLDQGLPISQIQGLLQKQGIWEEEVKFLYSPLKKLEDKSPLQVVIEEQVRQSRPVQTVRKYVPVVDREAEFTPGRCLGNLADLQIGDCMTEARARVTDWAERVKLPDAALSGLLPQMVGLLGRVRSLTRGDFIYDGKRFEDGRSGGSSLLRVEDFQEGHFCTIDLDALSCRPGFEPYWWLSKELASSMEQYLGNKQRLSRAEQASLLMELQQSREESHLVDHPYHQAVERFLGQFSGNWQEMGKFVKEALVFWWGNLNLRAQRPYLSLGQKYVLAARQLLPTIIWWRVVRDQALRWMMDVEAGMWKKNVVALHLDDEANYWVMAHLPRRGRIDEKDFDNDRFAFSLVKADPKVVRGAFAGRTLKSMPTQAEFESWLKKSGGTEVWLTKDE